MDKYTLEIQLFLQIMSIHQINSLLICDYLKLWRIFNINSYSFNLETQITFNLLLSLIRVHSIEI
jgi:hypothetical protein